MFVAVTLQAWFIHLKSYSHINYSPDLCLDNTELTAPALNLAPTSLSSLLATMLCLLEPDIGSNWFLDRQHTVKPFYETMS